MTRSCLLSFLFLLIWSGSSKAQSNYVNTTMISYGRFYPDQKLFRNPGKTSEPYTIIGFAIEHPRDPGDRNIYGEEGLMYTFSDKGVMDTLIKSWSDVSFYILIKYDVLPRVRFIDLNFGIGPAVGMQLAPGRIGSFHIYRNFHAAVLPHAEIKLQPLSRFTIGVSASYSYDLSNTNWKSYHDTNFKAYSKLNGWIGRLYLTWNWNTF